MAKKRRNGKKLQLGKKLISYSMAAGATLALTPSADAEVVYSGLKNIEVNIGSPVYIDLNGDSTDDVHFYANSATSEHYVKLDPLGSAEALKDNPPVSFFQRLPAGYAIGLGANFWSGNEGWLQRIDTGGSIYGNFVGQTGYIGVMLKTPSTQFCWINYQGTELWAGKIYGWACETQDQTAILAGDFGAADMGTRQHQAVPTLNEWGLMILAGLILAGGARRAKKLSSKLS